MIRYRKKARDVYKRQVGTRSKTDIVLCYMEDRADKTFLNKLRNMLENLNVPALTMAQESLNEALIKKGWYNPFPKVRYSERPDAAAASVFEGKIAIIIDNSPSVMLLPCAIFDFVQDTNDYYFPPVVGTYLRLVRMIVFFLTVFLTPVWYLLVRNPQIIPAELDFLLIQEPAAISVW